MKHGSDLRPETLVIHAGLEETPEYGAVSVPIYQSSTFSFKSAEEGAARFSGEAPGYKYTRLGNPTTSALESAVASLEGGYSALGTASGMAAISTVFLTFLEAGAHVVGTNAVYGPSRILLEKQLGPFGIASSWVPTDDLSAVEAAIRPETKMLYIESPANPTIRLSDLAACAELAHEADALLVVDNTFSSPMLQRPLDFGADIVLHSLTKFLNGHSDVVGGIIVSGREELHSELAPMLAGLGGTMDPHQAWLVLRGLRTLAMRIERSQANAQYLAEWLEGHPQVGWVSYPGLESHPQHDLASEQMKGPGAMISFGVKGGLEAGKAVINSVNLATRAVSLGGVESLIEHPASMTHAGMPADEREQAGITDDLVRLSTGCEAVEDLQADLDGALEQAAGAER